MPCFFNNSHYCKIHTQYYRGWSMCPFCHPELFKKGIRMKKYCKKCNKETEQSEYQILDYGNIVKIYVCDECEVLK